MQTGQNTRKNGIQPTAIILKEPMLIKSQKNYPSTDFFFIYLQICNLFLKYAKICNEILDVLRGSFSFSSKKCL